MSCANTLTRSAAINGNDRMSCPGREEHTDPLSSIDRKRPPALIATLHIQPGRLVCLGCHSGQGKHLAGPQALTGGSQRNSAGLCAPAAITSIRPFPNTCPPATGAMRVGPSSVSRHVGRAGRGRRANHNRHRQAQGREPLRRHRRHAGLTIARRAPARKITLQNGGG